MRKYFWVAGLLLALLAAAILLIFPPETVLLPALVVLVVGLGMFFLGVFLREEEFRTEIRGAMKRYAQARQLRFKDSLSSDGLPSSITLFGRGKKRRCTNVIEVEVAGRKGMLFQFEYWVSGGYYEQSYWERRMAAFFPQAMKDNVDFQLDPEGMLEKITILFGDQDIDFTGTDAAQRFSDRYRLRGPDEQAIRQFFNEERFQFFADHGGLCVESNKDDLALWYERGFKDQWQAEWDHSLRSVDEWLSEELDNLLEAARRVLG